MPLLHPVGLVQPGLQRSPPYFVRASGTGPREWAGARAGGAGSSLWIRLRSLLFPPPGPSGSWNPKVQWPGWGPGRHWLWRWPPLRPISLLSCLPGGFFFPGQGLGGGGGQRVARAPVGRAGSDGGWSCMSQAKREAPLSGGGCEEGLQAGSLGGRRRWRWGWRRQEASLPPGLGCPGHRALGGCLHVTPPKPLVVFTPPHVSRMTSRAAFMMTVLLSLSLGPKRLGLAMNEASGQLL